LQGWGWIATLVLKAVLMPHNSPVYALAMYVVSTPTLGDVIQVLRLENNRLESLPANFGELQSLVKLDVSTNCLRQLPASMGRLKRIQRIDAANNLLKRVPPSMGHLKSVKELNLKYNSLDDRYQAKTEEGLSR
jgi:hypothetical protein